MNTLVIANFLTGYENDRLPFIINNDAFPLLNNMFLWRGRLKKKRGTSLLGRLQTNLLNQIIGTYTGGSFSGNIFALSTWAGTALNLLAPNANLIPASISINISVGGGTATLADINSDGMLITTAATGICAGDYVAITGITNASNAVVTAVGHIMNPGDTVWITGVGGMVQINNNYYTIVATGVNTITLNVDSTNYNAFTSGGIIARVQGNVLYSVNNLTPVNDLIISTNYGFINGSNVSVSFGFYPDLPVMGLENFDVGVINNPQLVAFDTIYSYQYNASTFQFYNVTFYASSGTPFVWTGQNYNQFYSTNYSGAMWVCNSTAGLHFATIINITGASPSNTYQVTLDNSNLVVGDKIWFNEVQAATNSLNGVTGTISNASLAPTYTVTFTDSQTLTGFSSGIVQLLTSSRANTGNGIKFYTGDPTISSNGWVNFAPPLSSALKPLYLQGAKLVVPFKGRLLFFAPTIGPANGNVGTFYPNWIIYSQDGTPFYNELTPPSYNLFIPGASTFTPMAWWQDVAGFGGYLGAPVEQEIITVDFNKDVLIIELEASKSKLIFTADDSLPFILQTINSELGSQSTFSAISLDTGGLSIGQYGITLTTQESAQRIDLQTPDQIFDISDINNFSYRVTAIRDFRNEFVYFTYGPKNRPNNNFNSKTLHYNYRENNWATFDENYTHYGTFQAPNNLTWANLNQRYKTWQAWTDPWNFGSTGAQYPDIIGGNQQGFVLIKDSGTYEDISQYISAVSGITITSPNHCLNDGDFISISNCIGTPNINGLISKIKLINTNQFSISTAAIGTYIGGGVYRRLTNINVQSKQFPTFWNQRRKCRIGTQRFLCDKTSDGQITVNIFTSQNNNFASNDPTISLYAPFSNVLLTSPEPYKPYQDSQDQIWHRMSNSFIGDTVQVGFTLSDAQMMDENINSSEIIIHAIVLDLYPGPVLA